MAASGQILETAYTSIIRSVKMSDFGDDFFIDPGITIKQEPNSETITNTSASVPIPLRRDVSDYRDLGIDLENSQSPLYTEPGFPGQFQTPDIYETSNYWGSNKLLNTDEILKSEALIHMDDDDIFQVDKADLIQGPTLAELNANDETLLESTYVTLGKNVSYIQVTNHTNNNQVTSSSCPPQSMLYYKDLDLPSSVPTGSFDYYNSKTPISTLSPTSQNSSNSSIVQPASSPLHISSLQQKHSTLHDLLVKRETYVSPDRSLLGQSVPSRNSIQSSNTRISRGHISRLSSSAPTHLGLEQIWQRREPRKHLLSTGSQAEAGSTSSLSTGGILSPDPPDFSHDEESDEDSDGHYEDFSSDNGDSDDDDEQSNKTTNGKKERYFWQYNVQAKGPKGQRLVMKCKLEDPHCLHEVTDPVFSPDCSVRGIKHSGKARKGDGNDLTPNPKKLYNIGKELDKLGRIINDMTPVSELPFNVRPTSRKEKNKLASRACRLKKKSTT
ncbi:hypothetical protein NQ318_023382 [Aromia moschata]|uniref:BZIP domain-containing protein n=1 Tax=Aromia moschata TaxID=1265417 RepID=A0AAV8YV48_9CUCU|nr:hypothetical protein NQ318_023382 [Aromia moschata]